MASPTSFSDSVKYSEVIRLSRHKLTKALKDNPDTIDLLADKFHANASFAPNFCSEIRETLQITQKINLLLNGLEEKTKAVPELGDRLKTILDSDIQFTKVRSILLDEEEQLRGGETNVVRIILYIATVYK